MTSMSQLDRFRETIISYRKHEWQLRRVLMRQSTADVLAHTGECELEGIAAEVSSVDALWFARPSHAGREAWELRLVSDTPYALFEAFEADCDAGVREEALHEMQTRLIEYDARD